MPNDSWSFEEVVTSVGPEEARRLKAEHDAKPPAPPPPPKPEPTRSELMAAEEQKRIAAMAKWSDAYREKVLEKYRPCHGGSRLDKAVHFTPRDESAKQKPQTNFTKGRSQE